MSAPEILRALECDRGGCQCHATARHGHGVTHCPAHSDRDHPSLSITERNGKLLWHCFAGCEQKDVIAALRERSLIGPNGRGPFGQGSAPARPNATQGITLAELAAAKGLNPDHLAQLGWRDDTWHGQPAVAIPYHDVDGKELAVRYRIALAGDRFRWPKGTKVGRLLYGADRLAEWRAGGDPVLLVTGETDCAACWQHGIAALGVPGQSVWGQHHAALVADVPLVVWEEPGEQFARRVQGFVPSVRVIDASTTEVKDPCEAAVELGDHFGSWLRELISAAQPLTNPDGDSYPQIECYDRGLRDLGTQRGKADDALRVLTKAHQATPTVFERARVLVRIGELKADAKGTTYPVIEVLSPAALSGELARLARFSITKAQGPRLLISPPKDIVQDLLARGEWPGLHSLAGVTETPIVRSDGSIVSDPGYDPRTWLYYSPPPGFRLPRVSDEPQQDELTRAIDLIAEAFYDFPFADDASRAGAWALLLTPFVRPMLPYEALTPLAVIDAPTQGTGKGLLLDLITTIATGRIASKWTAAADNDEWRKELVAAAIEGRQWFVIDNVDQPLGCAALDSAITAGRISGRVLGHSRTVDVPVRWVWVATGNNVNVIGDLGRRCYWIRLVSDLADPTERTDFLHPELLEWARATRGDLVWAVLTIIRSWVAAGRPVATVPAFGSFEAWSRLIGSILAHAGVDGFLSNLRDFRRRSDRSRGEWEAFLDAWEAVLGKKWVTTGELARRLLNQQDESSASLRDALPSSLARPFDQARIGSEQAFMAALGKALARVVDRWFGSSPQFRLERMEDAHQKSAVWRVTARDLRRVAEGCGGSGPDPQPHARARAYARAMVQNRAETLRNPPQPSATLPPPTPLVIEEEPDREVFDL